MILFLLYFLLCFNYCYSQTANFEVKDLQASQVANTTVQLVWTTEPKIKSFSFLKILHSNDNWQSSINIPVEFIITNGNGTIALITNTPFDMISYYKISICDSQGVCSNYSNSSNAIDTRINLQMELRMNKDTSISINWKQNNTYEYPISNYKLEVSINNDLFIHVPGSIDYFQSNLVFVRSYLYTKDLSNYISITLPSSNTQEKNLEICKDSSINSQLSIIPRIFFLTTSGTVCYFYDTIKPFYLQYSINLDDTSGYLLVNSTRFLYLNINLDSLYLFKLTYKTIYGTTNSTTAFYVPLPKQSESRISLAIAIAVPIGFFIFLVLSAILAALCYKRCGINRRQHIYNKKNNKKKDNS